MSHHAVNRRAAALGLTCLAVTAPLASFVLAGTWAVVETMATLLAVAAGYAVGAWLSRLPALLCVVAVTTSLTVANQVHGQAFHWLDDLFFYLVLVGGAAAAGLAITERARQVVRLTSLQAELEEQHRLEAAAAQLEEQNRIQHEVHAGLAERIAGIALRAEGALRVGDHSALPRLESEARSVLDELRQTLGSMRTGPTDPPAPLEPVRAPVRISTTDVALAAAIGVAMAVETTVVAQARGPLVVNALACLLAAAPLVLRRRHPIASGLASLAIASMSGLWLTPISSMVTGLALLIAVSYAVGAWSRGRQWLAGWAAVAAGSVVTAFLTQATPAASALVGVLLLTVVAAALGKVAAGWQQRIRRTAAVVEELRRGRGAAVKLAVAHEREALAGQLHDTVAHAMTVVCLHAAAGQAHGDPSDALVTIAAAADASLAELRDGIEAYGSAEHPLEASRIAALGRRMGVDVSLAAAAVDGAAAGLAYRVIREAIVNVARHAPGASAGVTVARDEDTVTVEIADSGTAGAPTKGAGTGTGLVGLARAVESAGGTLTWGARTGGGYVVRARIPEGS